MSRLIVLSGCGDVNVQPWVYDTPGYAAHVVHHFVSWPYYRIDTTCVVYVQADICFWVGRPSFPSIPARATAKSSRNLVCVAGFKAHSYRSHVSVRAVVS